MIAATPLADEGDSSEQLVAKSSPVADRMGILS
jgi:hypothetical protein